MANASAQSLAVVASTDLAGQLFQQHVETLQESSNSNPSASSHRINTSVPPTYDHLYMSCAVSPHLGRCSMLLRIAGVGRQKSLARTCKGGEVFLAFVGVGKMCHPEIFRRGFHQISYIRIQIPMMLQNCSINSKHIEYPNYIMHPKKGLFQAVCYRPSPFSTIGILAVFLRISPGPHPRFVALVAQAALRW